MSFLSKLTFTHWRTCQSSSWLSPYWFVFSPSRLIRYLRSTFVTGQALTTSPWVPTDGIGLIAWLSTICSCRR